MRVAIVGGGSIGSMTAWQLVQRGHEVVILDRFDVPNGHAAHAGESRLLRSLPYLERAVGDRDIIAASTRAWQDLQAAAGGEFVALSGGVIIGSDADPELRIAADIARTRDGDAAVLDAAKLRTRYPHFVRISDDERAVLDPQGGLVDSQAAVRAACSLAIAGGAQLRTGERVVEVTADAVGAKVRTDHDVIDVDSVVVATGAFLPELLPELPVRARRLLLGWFVPVEGAEGYLRTGSFLWASRLGFLYGAPSYDGRSFKIGTDAAWGEAVDPVDPGARIVSDADAASMIHTVRELLPWLGTGNARFEMHVDGWTPDQHGLLGPTDETGRIVVSAGFSGHGFKMAPVLGAITADVVTGCEPAYDISHLDPRRVFAPAR